jgi:acetyl-CoA C-acetyltransferase
VPISERVAVVGVGHAGFAPLTAGLSYKELMFEAAQRAYADAGVHPRTDVDSFVTCAEDFLEGTSIFDEYTPDQLGAALRPMHTVTADGLHGIAVAVMLIRSGIAEVVAVEAHSKASEAVTLDRIVDFAQDPVLARPLGINPAAVAGLEMRRFMAETRTTEEQVARVVVKNRRNALANPSAAYPALLSVDQVLASEPVAEPLRAAEVAGRADGSVVAVLASERAARRLADRPVWVTGVGWSQDAPSLESRSWGEARAVRLASERAYAMAGLRHPRRALSLAEVNDVYAYKELQHLEALRLARPGEAGPATEEGATERDGELPVNPSGGALGRGHLFEAGGLAQALECVLQLRGEAGERQVPGARAALAASWRGVPTTSAAVAIFQV